MGNANRTPEQKYHALTAELREIENAHGGSFNCYLSDECVDAENAGVPENHPDFYERCYASACAAAGARAEELGLDINALLGRRIY